LLATREGISKESVRNFLALFASNFLPFQKRCPSFSKTKRFVFPNEGLPFRKRCPSFFVEKAAGRKKLDGKAGQKEKMRNFAMVNSPN